MLVYCQNGHGGFQTGGRVGPLPLPTSGTGLSPGYLLLKLKRYLSESGVTLDHGIDVIDGGTIWLYRTVCGKRVGARRNCIRKWHLNQLPNFACSAARHIEAYYHISADRIVRKCFAMVLDPGEDEL